MNSFSLLISLSSALIIVLAVAAVLIAGGIAAVLISGKVSAGRSGKRNKKQIAEKPAKAKKLSVTEAEKSEKPVITPVANDAKPSNAENMNAVKAEKSATEPAAENPVDEAKELKPVADAEPLSDSEKEIAEIRESAPEVFEEIPAEQTQEPTSEAGQVKEPERVYPVSEKKTAERANAKTADSSVAAKKVEVVKSDDGNAFVRIRYNRSFTAKLIQSDDKVKNYYSQIKNELKKYPVKERTSWRYETFKTGRKLLAKITLRGKTLCLYCALDAADYADTKYKVEDVSSKKSNADVPALFRIKNDRRAKYSRQIIADLMSKHSLEGGEGNYRDYAAQYPYEELEPLIERKLVKLLALKSNVSESEVVTLPVTEALPKEVLEEVASTQEAVEECVAEQPEPIEEPAPMLPPEEVLREVSVTQADEILPDEKVEIFIKQSEKVSDKSKRAIVNIDTLGKHFKANEKVTLEEIKRRIPDVNKRITYIKILARGTLDKPLEIEADDFSPAAVKMIVLTGGKVTRTRALKN